MSTPPVGCGFLGGVLRQYLLKTFPDQVTEQVLTKKEIAGADMVYIGNSVRGLVPVHLQEISFTCSDTATDCAEDSGANSA